MFKNLGSKLLSSKPDSIARAFTRLGWVGFWLQLVLAVLPVLLLTYVLFFSSSAAFQLREMGIKEYLVLIEFLILSFTIFWFYHYTRLGRKMTDPETRPSKPSVVRTLWIGLWASCFGIAFSMILMIVEVSRLLLLFLRAPQGGVPVVQTETKDPSSWVSAIDMMGLLADLSVLAAELVVLAFTLWLLLRVGLATAYDTTPNKTAT